MRETVKKQLKFWKESFRQSVTSRGPVRSSNFGATRITLTSLKVGYNLWNNWIFTFLTTKKVPLHLSGFFLVGELALREVKTQIKRVVFFLWSHPTFSFPMNSSSLHLVCVPGNLTNNLSFNIFSMNSCLIIIDQELVTTK